MDPSRAGARGKTLPPAHLVSDFLAVSGDFLEVLQQFELGKFVPWPITLLKRDKTTEFEGDWFAVWIGNHKRAFLQEKSTNFHVPILDEYKHISIPISEAVDGDYVLDASVLDGPDIWRDPIVNASLLVSDRLRSALADAGLLKKLDVLRCAISK